MTTCLHCGPTHRALAARGLCWLCSQKPAVRRLYPRFAYPKVRAKTPRSASYGREPSAEEVERIVAEQMKPENLPTWWIDEERKQGRGTDPPDPEPEPEEQP